MSNNRFARGAAISGLCFCALVAGGGVASAAYLGAGGGVVATGGGGATFSGGGFSLGSTVTIVVTYCGGSHTFTTTADSAGNFSLPTVGAGTTTFSATGTNPDGSVQTLNSSAVLDATCPGVGGTGGTGTGTGTGTGGGGLPFTGFEAGAAAAIGLGAIGAGTVVVMASRRRRSAATG